MALLNRFYGFHLFFFLFASTVFAQENRPVTLSQLLALAEKNYPALKQKRLEAEAVKTNISISKNSLMPRLDAMYQANYATYNNITGMSFPQYLLPISGPPLADNRYNGVFGSAASLLMQWEPVTFGRRRAETTYAETEYGFALKNAENEILKHKVETARAYLDYLASRECVNVYHDNVNRLQTILKQVSALQQSGLRPGADTALFAAEKARAQIDLANAEKQNELAKLTLLNLLGKKILVLPEIKSFLNTLPDESKTDSTINNPLLGLYQSQVKQQEQKLKVIQKSLLPKLTTWGTVYGRGSGVDVNGLVNTTAGLQFSRYNYGLGLQLSIPVLQFAETNKRSKQQNLYIQAAREAYNETQNEVNKQMQVAESVYSNAVVIARSTPVYVRSAEYAYRTLSARFSAGLIPSTELLQAQYQLAQAQLQFKNSYLEVWKALLFRSAVTGNLNTFLNQVKE